MNFGMTKQVLWSAKLMCDVWVHSGDYGRFFIVDDDKLCCELGDSDQGELEYDGCINIAKTFCDTTGLKFEICKHYFPYTDNKHILISRGLVSYDGLFLIPTLSVEEYAKLLAYMKILDD